MTQDKKLQVKEILKTEQEFCSKLLTIEPRNSFEAIWLPAFVNQSLLFQRFLIDQTSNHDTK